MTDVDVGMMHERALPPSRRVGTGRWIACALGLGMLGGCVHRPVPPPRAASQPVLPPTVLSTPASGEIGAGVPRLFARTDPGTGQFAVPPASQPAPVVAVGPDHVTLNFDDTDVREVARDVLGRLLHLTYTVDPEVKAKITLNSGHPLPRAQVLPTMEVALRSAGLALLRSGNIYRILTLKDAAKASAPLIGPVGAESGFETRVFQLHYVSAAELRKTLVPFVGAGSVVEADTARNVLIASGPRDSLDNVAALVHSLDVNWMKGLSFATYPLRFDTASDMAKELTQVFGTTDHGRLNGAVQIVPLDRQNMILVITTQPAYLATARSWVSRLDVRNPDATMQLYEYHVQNAQASDLASVLSRLLGTGGGGGGATEGTAPTTRPTLISGTASQGGATGQPMDGIGGATGGAGGLGALGGGTQTGGSLTGGGLTGGGATGGGLAGGAAGSSVSPTAAASGLLGGGSAAGLSDTGGSSAGGGGPGMRDIRIVADKKDNTLLFYAKPAEYRMVERLIRKLDVVPPQVKIDATIAEVTLNHNLQYGLQYFLKNGSGTATLSTLASGAVSSVFPGFNYAITTNSQQIILSALAGITHVNVVSSPQVLVLDHQPAYFQVGAQVPVPIQQSQSQLVANAPLISTIEYHNTGVILQVTPRVSSSGVVELNIDQQVSDVAPTTSSSLNAPTFNQRQITSSVVVGDNETIALGGLISTTTNRSRNGIPLLMNIPYLGALFSTTSNQTTRTELLVLLTPRVIRDTFDARAETEELRKQLRLVAPLVRALAR
jgi:general secretion pathway protein D